jgi:hypothetical protein
MSGHVRESFMLKIRGQSVARRRRSPTSPVEWGIMKTTIASY